LPHYIIIPVCGRVFDYMEKGKALPMTIVVTPKCCGFTSAKEVPGFLGCD
jgi:hypothetical protein